MPLPFTVYLDTEMNILHTDQGCPGLKVPSKYGYMRVELVRTVEQARSLDRVHRPCDRCRSLTMKATVADIKAKKPYRKRGYDGGRT